MKPSRALRPSCRIFSNIEQVQLVLTAGGGVNRRGAPENTLIEDRPSTTITDPAVSIDYDRQVNNSVLDGLPESIYQRG